MSLKVDEKLITDKKNFNDKVSQMKVFSFVWKAVIVFFIVLICIGIMNE